MIIAFILSSLGIFFVGSKIAKIADRLADRTGLGEALMGGIILGASTSLSGSTLSIVAAHEGLFDLSIGNALGGICAQTFFLFIADICYRRSNLEHASASSTNILLGLLLIVLLSIPLLSISMPKQTFFGVHPGSLILVVVYIMGIKYASMEKKQPMWKPKITEKTVEDRPDEPIGGTDILAILWIKFVIYGAILIFLGIVLKSNGTQIADQLGISQLALGGIVTAIITALPELTVTIAAVNRGAITLAVSGIIGGNTFDILVLAFSDIAYRDGSLYHQMNSRHIGLIGLNILISSVLLMGLIRREKHGFINIGVETVAIGIIYVAGFFLILY